MAQSVTFTPSPQDAFAASAAATPGKWGRFERLRHVLAGISLALLAFFVIARYDWQFWGLFILSWEHIASFAFAGAAMGWTYRRVRPAMRADDPRLGERTVSVGDAGLAVAGHGFRTEIDWDAVQGIAERPDMVLFTTAWKDIHFVPRSAFTSTAAADMFTREARNAWSARWAALNRKPGGVR
ncbi:hypothetical protein BH10PSE9_BH10PSE9_18480 [soil metagenome]